MRIRLVTLTVLLVAAAIAAAAAPARTAKAGACTNGTTAKTSSYMLALELGPRQEMYMPSEVQARKLKTGQVMLGGAMAMIDKVPAGMKVFDLAGARVHEERSRRHAARADDPREAADGR